jgi:hypothetical protein
MSIATLNTYKYLAINLCRLQYAVGWEVLLRTACYVGDKSWMKYLCGTLADWWWPGRTEVDCVWNVMSQGQKPDFIFRQNGRVHLNRRGRQFSRLLAAEVCASAVVMLAAPCSEVVWRVLVTHSIRQFPLHFPSRASPLSITFQLDYTRVEEPVPFPFANHKFRKDWMTPRFRPRHV